MNAIPDDSGFASMMNTANTLYRRGQNEEALDAYHRALSFWPDAPQALSRIAVVHLNLGDNAKARQHAARAVEVDPTNSEGWIVLGAALEALRDRPGAIAAYRKCATLGSGPYVTECRRLSR
jgi:Flp pilus assembly protein TadD